MLSISLPTYRFDVRPLVAELLRQATADDLAVEILVYDDASPDDGDWGRTTLRTTPGIRYVELPANLGRAAIRNRMARDATHHLLVMMDADGWPNPHFLNHWARQAAAILGRPDDHPSVIVGGRHYAAEPPTEPALHLHWWYGTQRESPTVTQRLPLGALGFQSNNFMVARQVMTKHPFPEAHQGYGHEDTLWGQQVALAGVGIGHLDNPVIHLGLEANDVFLRKQKEAIGNLCLLHQLHPHLRTRLIDLVTRFPLLPALARLVPEAWLTAYLTGQKRPSLYALDLLKLRWWKAAQRQH